MSDTLDRIVPEAGPKGEALYRHDAEGMFVTSRGWEGGMEGLMVDMYRTRRSPGARQVGVDWR